MGTVSSHTYLFLSHCSDEVDKNPYLKAGLGIFSVISALARPLPSFLSQSQHLPEPPPPPLQVIVSIFQTPFSR